MTVPKLPDRVQVVARIDPATRQSLRIKAAQEDRTMGEIIEDAIRFYCRRPAQAPPKLPRRRPSRAKKGLQGRFNK